MALEGRPPLEVADVVRAHGERYRRAHGPSSDQSRVLQHLATCRTAALGGHLEQCDACGHQRISYNSCRDRHCPKCQSTKRAQWLTERLRRLLPTEYFHVVFTIPHALNPLALRNKRRIFDVLFESAAQTLSTIARDEKHLGAQIGFTAVLHTWGQNLLFHPHVHCVVTGGGLAKDGQRWVAARRKYLLPVQVLGRLFRGKFLAALELAYRAGELELGASCASLSDRTAWRRFKSALYAQDWVVYAKAPFGGPEHVFRYLGRYTHRVAISNHRLVRLAEGRVTFTWKDYAAGCKRKLMTLDAVEFLRRFLLHVLPNGYVRIRHYGLCASRNVAGKLETARRLLERGSADPPSPSPEPESIEARPWWERFKEQTGLDVLSCPICLGGRMARVRDLLRWEAAPPIEPLATVPPDP